MKVDIDPSTFEPVYLRGGLDLQTHRELGLDLSKLEDPSPKGLIHSLRIAAAHFIVNTPVHGQAPRKFTNRLGDAFWELDDELRSVTERYEDSIRGVTTEHPAIQAYAERNPKALENASDERHCTGNSHLQEAVQRLRLFSLVLIRPNDQTPDPDADHHPAYRMIEGPAVGLVSPFDEGVPQQLVQARLGVAGIVGL